MKTEMQEIKDRVAKLRLEMDVALQDARKAARKARDEGYSITAIAENLGVTRQTIYNFFDEEDS